MLKTKAKFIITFVTIVFAIILFNTSTVNATSYTSDELEEILDLIPDEISVDVEEVEYEKAKTIIEEYVTEILENNGIDVQNLTISVNTEPVFYSGSMISICSNGSDSSWKNKSLSVIYSNSDDYNASDESYVKSLSLTSPRYYEVSLDYLAVNYDIWEDYFNLIEEYYTNLVNDDTITIKGYAGAGGTDGGLNLWTWEGGTCLIIFRNGVFYEARSMGNECTIPVVTVPSTVSDDDLTNYVIDLITETYSDIDSDIGSHISEIVSGINDDTIGIDITNGYTVYFDSDDYCTSYIIINRETSSVDLTENETNIKLEADTTIVPSNTVLCVEPITTGSTYETVEKALSNVSQFVAYDITLLSDGVEIQPNGNVKISIPIPEGFDTNNLVVYRIDEDGTKTKYDVTISNGYAVFETDHFSTYVLAELEDTTTTEETTDNELDNTPKTGTTTNIITYGVILGIVTVLGIAIIRKK